MQSSDSTNTGQLCTTSEVTIMEGQVCDRCRQKKIKCDGSTPACSNCAASGTVCEVSVRLRRKTKLRGYSATDNTHAIIERLEKENAQLKAQIQGEVEISTSLRRELERTSSQLATNTRPVKVRKLCDQGSLEAQSPLVSLSGESETSNFNRSAFVIKHMGRMVFDQMNVGRFAGSTTGVHFVASVESICRRARPTLKAFPEDCFRLHLVQPKFSSLDSTIAGTSGMDNDRPNTTISICALLNQSVEYYVSQLDTFNKTWMALCPVMPRGKFSRDTRNVLETLRSGSSVSSETSSAILALLMILLINREASTLEEYTMSERLADDHMCLGLACQLQPQVVARGDLSSLQALILFSFYLQITGQTSWLMQVNGIQVRLAQSLGMHRHARRFRFTESEMELRKRMWWWIHSFDKITSLVHGLPKLISDSDVDNDLPIDCELYDINVDGLSHPLPGEPTPMFLHIHYLNMSKLLSAVLGQLYTTSQRRGGEEKIARLDRDLRVWHQNLNSMLQMLSFDISDVDRSLSRTRLQHFGDNENYIFAWLDIMANFALVLIHRPALTFDNGTQRFRESLNICMKSSSAIIQLASASSFHRRAIRSAPFGPNVIFQSALMHIFYHCSVDSEDLTDGPWSDPPVIAKAIRVLKDMMNDVSSSVTRKDSTKQCIILLEILTDTFFGLGNELAGLPAGLPNSIENPHDSGFEGHHDAGASIMIPHVLNHESIDIDFWNSSALESLNHLDVFYGSWEGATGFVPPDT